MKQNYKLYTTNEIRPRGWLKRQLELQANGQNGALDLIWPDVRDSMWVGGDREGWERVPYWLDGFIPLAYLLDDKDMKARSKRYIDHILEFQKPDGWICPNGDTPIEEYDTWAVQLIAKVLTVYYQCSRDERVPDALYRLLHNYYELLTTERIKLFGWAKYRWFETFIAINALKELYPNAEWIYGLAAILKEQGADYSQFTELWKDAKNEWRYDTHVVNITMMLKSEAVSCGILGEEYTDLAERLYSILKKYNGTAVGTVTGDECLAGLRPIQGTELCSVVEQMYSYELLYAYTGDKKWAERLEKVSFNALPATISEDMWTHQYVQMVNQIDCTRITGNPPFRTNGGYAHTFGLEPHYGCCTANFGQGFPKLALSTFMRADDGIVSVIPIPSEVCDTFRGANVRVTLDTEYPFKNQFLYRVESDRKTDMKLKIRVPSFAEGLTVNGRSVAKRGMLVFGGFEAGVTEIRISFDTSVCTVKRPRGQIALERGSLVFALPIESEWTKKEFTKDGVERKFPYCDYIISRKSDWEYALADTDVTVNERDLGDIAFSEKNAALTLTAKVYPIDWGYEEGYSTVARAYPKNKTPLGDAKTVELIPYGCTTLRLTEMPIARKKQ